MSTAPPAMHDFARRLIALEAARADGSGAPFDCAVRVCDRLRVPLARLAGEAGYRSLLARALALAKGEVPTLAAATVCADGTLDGLDRLLHDADAGAAIVARLLELLVTFIGEPLTLRLVSDAWPDAPTQATGAETGEQS